MPRLAGRVKIPFNNNVIDIVHQIRLTRTGYTRTVYPLLWCTVPTSYEQRAYNNARNRPKQRTYVPNLPGRARAPLNYN